MNQNASSGATAMRHSPSQEYATPGPDAKPKFHSSSHKRASRAGTRSVTTLSVAQLERKRANDREAQRAIRQRTKDHIESLERRVNELTVTYESREKAMAETEERNKQLENENAYLRTRLGSETLAEKPSDYSVATTTSPPSHLTGNSIPRPSSTSTSRSVPMAPLHTAQQPESWRSHHGFVPSGGSTPTAFLSDPAHGSSASNSASWRAQEAGDPQARMDQASRNFTTGSGASDRTSWMNSAHSYGYSVRPNDRTAGFPPASQSLSFASSQPPAFQAVTSQSETTPVSAAFHTPGLVSQTDYPQMASYSTSQQPTFHEPSQPHPGYQVTSASDFHNAASHRGGLAPPSYTSSAAPPQFMPAQPSHVQSLVYRPETTAHSQYGYDG